MHSPGSYPRVSTPEGGPEAENHSHNMVGCDLSHKTRLANVTSIDSTRQRLFRYPAVTLIVIAFMSNEYRRGGSLLRCQADTLPTPTPTCPRPHAHVEEPLVTFASLGFSTTYPSSFI